MRGQVLMEEGRPIDPSIQDATDNGGLHNGTDALVYAVILDQFATMNEQHKKFAQLLVQYQEKSKMTLPPSVGLPFS